MIIEKVNFILKRFCDQVLYRSKTPFPHPEEDEKLKRVFCSDKPFEERIKYLISYFVRSWIRSASNDFTRAYFYGEFSYNNRDIDAIEGSTRFLPLIASVLVNEKYGKFDNVDEKGKSLEEMFISAIVNGTDPSSKGYWGEIDDYSQLICEGADVALAVWIARDKVIEQLSRLQKQNLFVWLSKCASKKIVDNNWHLFRQTIQLILSNLNEEKSLSTSSYARVKSFYVGDGWFSDGEGEKYDFYNAWAFHYSLFWINEIDKEFDNKFISDANYQFCRSYHKLFTLKGFPIFGRSHCYRTAACSPLLASILLKNGAVEKGTVKRIFDQLWKFFISNGAVEKGVPTQGYLKKDIRFLDEYSGPASPLWGLRSLILFLHCDRAENISQVAEAPLAIEMSNFKEQIDSIGLRIIGNKANGSVSVDWLYRRPVPKIIEPYRLKDRLKGFLSQRPKRPKNSTYKNKLKTYSSECPFIEDEM